MTLLEEYKKQNLWREWYRYLQKIPLGKDKIVYDLGCSTGEVSKLFAAKVKRVVGLDINRFLLDEANRHKPDNCKFIHADISSYNTDDLPMCDVIWTSYTLAYMKSPGDFITKWSKCLKTGGLFAIADIDGLFSSHLSSSDEFLTAIEAFEKKSEKSNLYDFLIGRKIKRLISDSGMGIFFFDEDWDDRELNFSGSASEEIIANWTARLARMERLKDFLGTDYPRFCSHFMNVLSREDHRTTNGLMYVIGVKR